MGNGTKKIAMLLHSKGATLASPDDHSKQLEIWLNEEQSEKQRIEAERIKAEQIKAENIKAEQIRAQQIKVEQIQFDELRKHINGLLKILFIY